MGEPREVMVDKADDLLKYDSLAFFGKVNASISHELKNIMAIISETAGLLGDLADLASRENPVEPDMLKNCAGSIVEEIQRGFSTIRQMNRFSHSVDIPIQTVNLLDTLDLVIHLSAFLSFAGTARITISEADKPVVLTCPFLLQTVFYQALLHTYKYSGPGSEISVSIDAQDPSAWRIAFSGAEAKQPVSFPDEATARTAAAIGLSIHFDGPAGRLELTVPHTIESV